MCARGYASAIIYVSTYLMCLCVYVCVSACFYYYLPIYVPMSLCVHGFSHHRPIDVLMYRCIRISVFLLLSPYARPYVSRYTCVSPFLLRISNCLPFDVSTCLCDSAYTYICIGGLFTQHLLCMVCDTFVGGTPPINVYNHARRGADEA